MTNKTTRYYLVTADAVSVHANFMKDTMLSNARQILSQPFMHVNLTFPANETLEAIELTLDNNLFAFGNTY